MSGKARAARRHDLRHEQGGVQRLFAQMLPGLVRWTKGRLPQQARRRMDSEDLVQEALIGALLHIPDLEARDPDQVIGYIRQSIRNRIRDEIRRSTLGEVTTDSDEGAPDTRPTPLDDAITAENDRRFRAALGQLGPDDQVLVGGRVDHDASYEDLAAATGRPTADAARVGTRRALLRLARFLIEPERGPE